MIKFFRHIRKKLINQSRVRKYLIYAFGEIVLIMLGIFMALQLNNWNENRKQEVQFKETLEQLYNTISDDVWSFEKILRDTRDLIDAIDHYLSLKDSSDVDYAAGGLWFTIHLNRRGNSTETVQIINSLKYNSAIKEQSNLARQLKSFAEVYNEKINNIRSYNSKIADYILENNIPFPKFDINDLQGGFIRDTTYYSKEEIAKANQLLKDPHFRSLLKTQRSMYAFMHLDHKTINDDAKAMLNLIKQYHPDAKLLFQDVGIIGTSINGFDDVGAKSTPMTLVDEELSIWEITMPLKKGKVKFRCRDSWAINWGGDEFPKGAARSHGNDIEVSKPGTYKIVLNLTEYTYEFIKLE